MIPLLIFAVITNIIAQESADLYIIHSNHDAEQYSSCFRSSVNVMKVELPPLEANTYVHIKIPAGGIQIQSVVYSICKEFPTIYYPGGSTKISSVAPQKFHRGIYAKSGDTFFYIFVYYFFQTNHKKLPFSFIIPYLMQIFAYWSKNTSLIASR